MVSFRSPYVCLVPALAVGDTAPDLTLPDADGRDVSLASLRRGRLIVYFYPAALTPGCTNQAVDFQAALPELTAAAYGIVGISPDLPAKLARFRDEHGLEFALLSDPEHRALEAYGAWGEKQNYGKTYVGVIRSTYVIAPDGRVEAAYRNVRAKGHVARLLRELPGLAR